MLCVINLIVRTSIAVEKLPTWCFGGWYALMGRTRELSQQLLNEPFNEVKKRMVSFRVGGCMNLRNYFLAGRWYSFTITSRRLPQSI
jgi:hypothetical protein